MAWVEHVVIEVPGVSPEDAPGFVMWVDIPMAMAWRNEAKRRCSIQALQAVAGKPYAEQVKVVTGTLEALGRYYEALNLSWIGDRPATDLWWDWWGGWTPKDPDAMCTELTPGPNALWSPLTRFQQTARSAAGIYLSESERAKAYQPGGIGTQPILNGERLRSLWLTVKPDGLGKWDEGVECVVPAYLGYKSEPKTRLQPDPAAGTEAQHFDGVYTGAADGTRQVSTDAWQTAGWSLDSWRWDDAPFNRLRLLPPARLALDHLRAWVNSIVTRNPMDVARDARINTILINLERAKYYDPDGAGDFNAAVFDTLRNTNRSRWSPTEAQSALKTSAAVVCGVATAANPAAGFACGLISSFADALFGVIPRAVGCDIDQWGRVLPAAFDSRLSLGDPPAFDVPEPVRADGSVMISSDILATAQQALTDFRPMVLSDGLGVVVAAKKDGGTVIGTPQTITPTTSTSSSSSKAAVAVAGVAVAAGLTLALRRRSGRGRRR